MNKDKLHKIVLNSRQRPDYLAIELYLDIKNNLRKNKQSVFKTSYAYFIKKFKSSNETIRNKFVFLENLGLVKRSFTGEISPFGHRLHNVLNLSLLEGDKNE